MQPPSSWNHIPSHASRSELLHSRRNKDHEAALAFDNMPRDVNHMTSANIARKGQQVYSCLNYEARAQAVKTKSQLLQTRKMESLQAGQQFQNPKLSTNVIPSPRTARGDTSATVIDKSDLFGLGWSNKQKTRTELRQTRRIEHVQSLKQQAEAFAAAKAAAAANAPSVKSERKEMPRTRSQVLLERRQDFTADAAKFEPKKAPGVHKVAPPSYSTTNPDVPWYTMQPDYIDDPGTKFLNTSVRIRPTRELTTDKARYSSVEQILEKRRKKQALPVEVGKCHPEKLFDYFAPQGTVPTPRWTDKILEAELYEPEKVTGMRHSESGVKEFKTLSQMAGIENNDGALSNDEDSRFDSCSFYEGTGSTRPREFAIDYSKRATAKLVKDAIARKKAHTNVKSTWHSKTPPNYVALL